MLIIDFRMVDVVTQCVACHFSPARMRARRGRGNAQRQVSKDLASLHPISAIGPSLVREELIRAPVIPSNPNCEEVKGARN